MIEKGGDWRRFQGYGLAIGDWPLIGSNAATLTLMTPILATKLRKVTFD